MRDLKSILDVVLSLAPAVRTTGTANGTAVDLRGFDAAMVTFTTGAWTDGTHTPSVQHSDDGTNFTAVPADAIAGTLTAFTAAGGANAVQRVNYLGGKRYLRGVIVTAGATNGATSEVAVVRGRPGVAPIA